jgi:hypothetical protein
MMQVGVMAGALQLGSNERGALTLAETSTIFLRAAQAYNAAMVFPNQARTPGPLFPEIAEAEAAGAGETRGASIGGAPKRRIALGLEAQLDNFASANSAESWKQFAKADPMQWKSYFLDVMNDHNAEVVFNPDGVDVWAGVIRASRGAGGATDWELLQIMQNEDWWSRIKWIEDGVQVANPFQ